MPLKPFKLYVIDGIDYGAVIAKYRQLCQEGIKDIEPTISVSAAACGAATIIRKKPRAPLKDDTKILNKAKFLVHTIAYRQLTNREQDVEGATVKMSVLQDILGADAFELMEALISCGYITRSPIYQVGVSARRYTAIGTISKEPCFNATIRGYIEKSKTILKDLVIERLSSKSFTDEYGAGFAERYIKNLNRFQIKDKEGFDAYAKDQISTNPDTEAYYDYIRTAFKDKLRIYSIDANNRIYHILTSLKRELKQFINIRYSIDCSNSHPLLFNYFIFLSKQISPSISYSISSELNKHKDLIILSKDYSHPYSNAYFVSNNSDLGAIVDNIYYNTRKLRNILIDSGINKVIIDKFEDDELLYVWKTTCGIFWDDTLKAHEEQGLSRSEIKQKMFAEVFYSKTTRDEWKKFGQEFKAQYPNVYDLILRWKAPLSSPDTKAVLLRRNKAVKMGNRAWMEDETTALPNIMMDLESVIFRDILQALFRKRICAVHIHDAIVVPEVTSTVNLDPETICCIMREAYKRFGLCPTLKVETY